MLGARVYDSPSRRFLSTDPKAAIAGSSWFADVYAYAGNNPLEYVDPRGERPMTVADYRKYQSQEGERFMQQSLRLLALVGVIGSLFIAPTSILLAGGVGFISGAANGAADGMDFHTPDGNIDWDKVQAYALQEGGKEALTAALIGMLFKAGPPVARATGNQAMKVPVISRTVDRVKTSPVVIKTQNTVNAVKTRINGIQDRIATWTRTSLLGIEHVVPKVHPTPHNSPHQIDIPNGPKPTHTGSLDHRTSGAVHEPNVQLKPVEEPKVENLPPAKGVTGDSPSLEKPATDGKHASWVEHPPGSKLQNGDQMATYLAGDEFKKTLMKSTKDSSRYVPSEEPGTYNVYGFAEADKARREYYKKLNGKDSPADLSKGEPKFALWHPEVSEPNLDTAMTGFRNVTRHGNTVEAQVGSHKFMVTNLDEYTGTIPDDVVPTAKSLYETGEVHWTSRDYKPEGFGNKPNPLPFNNKEARILPTHSNDGNKIAYTEYKVRRLFRTQNQVNDVGIERLVIGSDGSMYYTPDHYKTFVRIF